MCRKSKTHTSTLDTDTYLPHPRTNGWGCPWNLYMVSVWAFSVLFSLFFFATQLPFLPQIPRYIFYVIGVGIFSILIISDVIAISINSGDPLVGGSSGSSKNRVRPIFDRSKHKHVIENLYCNLCQSEVGYATKHCKTCDKCVSDFDHHCKWLNNCVGNRNYWAFFVCVSSGFIGAVLNLLGSVCLFVLFFASRRHLCYWDCAFPCSNQTNTSVCIRLFHAQIPDPLFPALMGLECVLSLLAIGLLGQLYFFHLYLKLLGLSTFDYLNRKDQIKHEKLVKKHSDSRAGTPNRPPSRNTIRSGRSEVRVVQRSSDSSDTDSRDSHGMDTHPRTPVDDTPSHIYTHQYAISMEENKPMRFIPDVSQRHIESIEMEVRPFAPVDEQPEDSDISAIMISDSCDTHKQIHNNRLFNTSL